MFQFKERKNLEIQINSTNILNHPVPTSFGTVVNESDYLWRADQSVNGMRVISGTDSFPDVRLSMSKYKLIALAIVFVAFEQVPAQVTFTSETKLIIVNVSVKDKMRHPRLQPQEGRLRGHRRRQEAEGRAYSSSRSSRTICCRRWPTPALPKQLEERVAPAPKPAAPPAAAAAPASVTGSLENTQRKDRRLLAMFFDMTTMPQFDQIRAIEKPSSSSRSR